MPVAVLRAGEMIHLDADAAKSEEEINRALRTGTLPVALRPYYA